LAIALSPGLVDRTGAAVRRASDRALRAVLAFYATMAATALWAPDGADPDKLLELGLVLACVVGTLRLTRAIGPQALMTLVWRWLIPILSVFAVVGAITSGAGGRLAILGGGPNVFGRNMGILCVAMLGATVQGTGGRVALGGVVVTGALVLLSGSRGALLATTAGIAAVLWFEAGRLRRIATVGITVAIVTVGVLGLTDLGTDAIEMFRHRVLHLAIEDRYDSGRTDVYLRAWELGRGSSWTGIGLAGFEILGNHVYPHNLLLEVFCEGGLLGIVMLALVLGPPLWALVRRHSGPAPRDYAAFVVALVSAQFSGDLYDSRTVFVLAGLLTVLAGADPERGAAVRPPYGGPDANGRQGSTTREHRSVAATSNDTFSPAPDRPEGPISGVPKPLRHWHEA
jgi:O-antigen ligase